MDFHCHLDLYPEPREVYKEAARRNEFTWLVTTSPKAFIATSSALPPLENILITPGLHPEIAHERQSELSMLLEQMEATNAVGEVGLDGSFRHRSSLEIQRRIFDSVISRSQQLGGRTLSIHSRQAVGEVLATLLKYRNFGTAVLHWFTGGATELRTAVALDCWFSIGPAAFASEAGRALAARLPSHRVVPESDGPFAEEGGIPVPPWSQHVTAARLAQCWHCSEKEALALLTENSHQLLKRMGRS